MKFFAVLAATAVLSLNAAYAGQYQVSRSVELSSSPEEAWKMIGDFCDIDDWHPAISTCALKSIDGGVHRVIEVDGIGEFVEKLVATDPSGLNYTYSIVSSPAPFDRYTGTLSITRGNPSTLTWASRFSTDDPGLEAAVGGLYEAGLTAIKAALGE